MRTMDHLYIIALIFTMVCADPVPHSKFTYPSRESIIQAAAETLLKQTFERQLAEQEIASRLLANDEITVQVLENDNIARNLAENTAYSRSNFDDLVQEAALRYLKFDAIDKAMIATLQEANEEEAKSIGRMLSPANQADSTFASRFAHDNENQADAIARYLSADKLEKETIARLLIGEDLSIGKKIPQEVNPSRRTFETTKEVVASLGKRILNGESEVAFRSLDNMKLEGASMSDLLKERREELVRELATARQIDELARKNCF